MFTPQEVSEKVFPRSSFGGYQMSAVDEFLDSLTEDYSSLYKENATLKAKLKVLAEKIEEYRATEDAMRSTLLTAQRMGAQMVEEAQSEKDRILAEARASAADEVARLGAETALAQKKLAMAQEELAAFVQRSKELCVRQVEFLTQLPEVQLAAEEAPATEESSEDDTVRIIEEEVVSSFAAEEEQPAASVEEAPAEIPVVAEEESFADDFRLDLEGLKFGRNYPTES